MTTPWVPYKQALLSFQDTIQTNTKKLSYQVNIEWPKWPMNLQKVKYHTRNCFLNCCCNFAFSELCITRRYTLNVSSLLNLQPKWQWGWFKFNPFLKIILEFGIPAGCVQSLIPLPKKLFPIVCLLKLTILVQIPLKPLHLFSLAVIANLKFSIPCALTRFIFSSFRDSCVFCCTIALKLKYRWISSYLFANQISSSLPYSDALLAPSNAFFGPLASRKAAWVRRKWAVNLSA